MGVSNTATAPIHFRRIAPGVYGTNIHRVARGYVPANFDIDVEVEIIIERMPDPSNGYVYWYFREMLPDGNVTDWMTEPEATLRMCKLLITEHTSMFTDNNEAK